MLSPVIFFNLVLETIHGFQVFTSAFVISNGTGGPVDSTTVYTLYLYLKGFTDLEMGYASAMAWVFLVAIGADHRRLLQHRPVLGALLRRGRTDDAARRPRGGVAALADADAGARRGVAALAAAVVLVALARGRALPAGLDGRHLVQVPTEEIVSNLSVCCPRTPRPGNYTDGWTSTSTSASAGSSSTARSSRCWPWSATCVSCLLAAYAFARLRFRLRGMWFAIMIGTLLLPHHVLIMPQYMLFRSSAGRPLPSCRCSCRSSWPPRRSSSS